MAYRGKPVFKGGYIDFYREHKKYAIENIYWGYGGHTPLLTEAGKNNIAYLGAQNTYPMEYAFPRDITEDDLWKYPFYTVIVGGTDTETSLFVGSPNSSEP